MGDEEQFNKLEDDIKQQKSEQKKLKELLEEGKGRLDDIEKFLQDAFKWKTDPDVVMKEQKLLSMYKYAGFEKKEPNAAGGRDPLTKGRQDNTPRKSNTIRFNSNKTSPRDLSAEKAKYAKRHSILTEAITDKLETIVQDQQQSINQKDGSSMQFETFDNRNSV